MTWTRSVKETGIWLAVALLLSGSASFVYADEAATPAAFAATTIPDARSNAIEQRSQAVEKSGHEEAAQHLDNKADRVGQRDERRQSRRVGRRAGRRTARRT